MGSDVELLPRALDDLRDIADWLIEATADAEVAERYVRRVKRRSFSLASFPAHGTPRDELEAGLRSIPFERSATIFYRAEHGSVRIVRIIGRGRDVRRASGG